MGRAGALLQRGSWAVVSAEVTRRARASGWPGSSGPTIQRWKLLVGSLALHHELLAVGRPVETPDRGRQAGHGTAGFPSWTVNRASPVENAKTPPRGDQRNRRLPTGAAGAEATARTFDPLGSIRKTDAAPRNAIVLLSGDQRRLVAATVRQVSPEPSSRMVQIAPVLHRAEHEPPRAGTGIRRPRSPERIGRDLPRARGTPGLGHAQRRRLGPGQAEAIRRPGRARRRWHRRGPGT